MKHILKELVLDKFTNAEGDKLFTLLDKSITKKEIVQLSFDGARAFSTSFLTSIGELIEKYGFERFKQYVKFIDLRQSVANQLRDYLISCNLQV